MPASCDLYTSAPRFIVDFAISRDADWWDALPEIKNPDGSTFDLTGITLKMWVRPSYGSDVLLLYASSDGLGQIVIDNAAGGLASIRIARSYVLAYLPAGTWEHFLIAEDSGGSREIWRGKLVVEPGEISAATPYEPPPAGQEIALDNGPVLRDLRASTVGRLYREYYVTRGGVAFDLSGYTLEMVVRPTYTHETVILGDGDFVLPVTDASQGAFSLTVTEADMGTVPPGNWTYILRMSAGSTVIELQRGRFTVLAGAF